MENDKRETCPVCATSVFSDAVVSTGFVIRVALRATDLDSVLEAGGGLLTSLPPQRPFFLLSILFSCFMAARFSHTTANFYTNGKLTHPF